MVAAGGGRRRLRTSRRRRGGRHGGAGPGLVQYRAWRTPLLRPWQLRWRCRLAPRRGGGRRLNISGSTMVSSQLFRSRPWRRSTPAPRRSPGGVGGTHAWVSTRRWGPPRSWRCGETRPTRRCTPSGLVCTALAGRWPQAVAVSVPPLRCGGLRAWTGPPLAKAQPCAGAARAAPRPHELMRVPSRMGGAGDAAGAGQGASHAPQFWRGWLALPSG